MIDAVSKRELAEAISSKIGISQVIIKKVIDAFLEELVEQFKQGRYVELRKFGSFYSYYMRARKSRNPRTGAVAESRPRRTLRFKTSKYLHLFEDSGQ